MSSETTEDKQRPFCIDRAHDALCTIKQWCDAYPIEVFPEPVDLDSIRAKIGADEMSRLHASWARHILDGIRRYVERGL